MTDDVQPPGGRLRALRALLRALPGRLRRPLRAPSWRTVLRTVLMGLAVVVPSACWGVATASTEGSLGPHLARYEVTLDHEVTVDVGPLGTLVIDSPLPLVLGGRVVVQEIPRQVTAVTAADTLSALGSDLQSYVQFFTAPQATLDVAVQGLVQDAARRTLLASATVLLVVVVLRALLGPRRRAELAGRLRPWRGVTAGAAALALAVSASLTASDPLRAGPADAQPASAVFVGTPLEGARITGRLAGVIDTYGGYVVDAYKLNETFYDGVVDDLEVAWEERAEADARLTPLWREDARPPLQPGPVVADEPTAVPTVTAPGAPSQDVAGGPTTTPPGPTTGGGEASAATSGTRTAGPTAGPTAAAETGPTAGPSPEPAPGAEPVVALVVSDLHCNVGMARVIRAVARLADVDLVLNAGDSTVNGTAVESYCVNAFADAVPPGAQLVVADGNHDSDGTSDQERRVGAHVLDGDVVEVAGLRVLGDSDPNATRVGVGTVPVGEESVAEAGRRLADVACADEAGVDLLLVHNPNMGNATLDQGCAPAQVSGHLHRRVGPVAYRHGIRYVSTSTAGAALDQITVGPLNGVAELTVLSFDPDAGRFLTYRIVRVQPDGTVSVGPALRWPGLSTATTPTAPSGAR